jgi:hypothetical protein
MKHFRYFFDKLTVLFSAVHGFKVPLLAQPAPHLGLRCNNNNNNNDANVNNDVNINNKPKMTGNT